MKCNASPTTSIDPKPSVPPIVTSTVNAILFREVLKPLAASLGPIGDVAVDAVADAVFVRKTR